MVELTHVLGVILALCAALGLAGQVVLVRKGTYAGRATDAVLIVTLVNLAVLVPIAAVLYYPNYGLTRLSVASFVGAGLVGTLFGRLFKYTSIKRIGGSRTSPIVSSNAVFGVIIATMVLDEVLTAIHLIAIVLIVGGVATISWETSRENPQNLTRGELATGLALPFAAAVFYGAEPTFAKIGIEQGTPFLVGLLVKTIAAVLGFTLYLRYAGLLPSYTEFFSMDIKWYIGAGLANTAFIICYYAALSIAPVVVVYPIIPTNTLFVLALSAIFLPSRLETVSWRLVGSTSFIVMGVIIITMYG